MANKIEIPLGNGCKLVAERNVADYDREMFIGIVDENDSWLQDLAIVRSAYQNGDYGPIWDDNKFEVMVYAEPKSEDYTDCFEIEFDPA